MTAQTNCLHIPPGPLIIGASIEICFGPDPSHAGQTITVTMKNGDGDDDELTIALDSDGYGCANWTVPGWLQVEFSTGDCDPIARQILSS